MLGMSWKRWWATGTGLALLAASAVLVTPPAYAKKKTHKDEVRGFQCRIEDSWEQVPPKPGTDDLHVAAEWKDRSPKYRRFSGDQPTFRIIWTVTPKGETAAAEEEKPLPDWAKDLPEELQERVRQMQAGTKETLEGDVNKMLEWYDRLFGEYKPLAEHYAARKKPKIVKTADGQEVDVVEINYHKKRPKDPAPNWWMWVGRTGWEDDTEKVEIGFYGYVDVKFAKEFRKQFEATIKSFKLRETITDEEATDRFSAAVLPKDPPDVAEKIVTFLKSLPKDWEYERTENYLVVFDEDVDSRRIVNRVTREIEALREQVYEVIFPPDRPVTAVSIVRVCDSRQQYSEYGAPGGSAGYWSPYHDSSSIRTRTTRRTRSASSITRPSTSTSTTRWVRSPRTRGSTRATATTSPATCSRTGSSSASRSAGAPSSPARPNAAGPRGSSATACPRRARARPSTWRSATA
jgi:hypothetical protein